MQDALHIDTWSGDALNAPKLIIILGESSRELTVEDALAVAQKLMQAAREMAAEEGVRARARIALLLD